MKNNFPIIVYKTIESCYKHHHKRVFGTVPKLNWGRDRKLIKILLLKYSPDEITNAVEKFFNREDVADNRTDFPFFYYNIKKFI